MVDESKKYTVVFFFCASSYNIAKGKGRINK